MHHFYYYLDGVITIEAILDDNEIIYPILIINNDTPRNNTYVFCSELERIRSVDSGPFCNECCRFTCEVINGVISYLCISPIMYAWLIPIYWYVRYYLG